MPLPAVSAARRALLLPGLAALLLAGLLVWLLWSWQPGGDDGAPQAPALASAPEGGDFTLRSVDGPVSLSDFRGRVVLLYFGYTACPDICPTNLAIIGYALKQLAPAERAQVQVLFVSVDPARDDLARLAEYAAYFDPGILGITGSDAAVAAAAARYGAAYRRTQESDTAMGYLVDHSAFTYVIDPRGQLVDSLAHATPADAIIARIRQLLPAKT
ncbi:SCO family protein [uncultured Thiohalocapsa sp.]|uniref:SCO family protein n=1 Tax=uncultured Thiohalocapsa sp. TaxID=768990 RepID=UPI0025F6716E|nr:SCO family protein [uncultured Thiohalocapsa sp.]